MIALCLAMAAKAKMARAASARNPREYNEASAKYDMRVFLLHLGLSGEEFKNIRMHLLKRLIKAHLKSAFDAYWHENNDGDSAMTLLPRPGLENICAMLKAQFKEKKTLNVSTVHRTIQAALNQKGSYYDAEFKALWEGCLDENFVRRYASKMR